MKYKVTRIETRSHDFEIEADSPEEARTLAENDPAVKRGLFTDLEVEPWYHMM